MRSGLGLMIICLDATLCGFRCVSEYKEASNRQGPQCRCRTTGGDQLQRSLPKTAFLIFSRPLLRVALFACGFYRVHDCALPGYKYDARACVVANQSGVVELAYFISRFSGIVITDLSSVSVFFQPIAAALGFVDALMVEDLSPLVERTEREDSALAQYQALMALHNETHGGIHFGLPRLCLMMEEPPGTTVLYASGVQSAY